MDIEFNHSDFEKVGKYIDTSVAGGIAENDKLVVKAFSQMLEKLKYQREFDIISESEYYKKLESLRDRYFSVGTKEWVKYTAEIYSYQKEAIEKEKKVLEKELNAQKSFVEKTYADIADYALGKIGEIEKKQKGFSESLKNIDGIYDRGTIKLDEGDIKFYMLHDFEADIKELKEYNDLLFKARERIYALGTDEKSAQDILGKIGSMDLSRGTMYLKAIERADDTKLSRYLSLFAQKASLSESISANWYKDDFDKANAEALDYMKKKLTEAGFDIPEGFFVSGSLSAERFGEGFIESIDGVLSEIRTKIDAFNESLKIKVNEDKASIFPTDSRVYNEYVNHYAISATGADDILTNIKRYDRIRRMAGV